MAEKSAILTPNINFRANPARAIYIQGSIDQNLVNQITPKIIEFQNQSRDPITIYIDSLGGSISSAETIKRLLNASDQDDHPPCRIISVVTARAASAAADLLSFGDYAISYSESFILFHGTRHLLDDPVTVDDIAYISSDLKSGNERFAMELANHSIERWVFRYLFILPKFDEFKKEMGKPKSSDFECFCGVILSKLSENGKKIFQKTFNRYSKYQQLLSAVGKLRISKSLINIEGQLLKKIIDFEIRKHRKEKNWTFSKGGINQLVDDFYILNEYVSIYNHKQIDDLCKRWDDFFLTRADKKNFESLPEKEKEEKKMNFLKESIRPVWLFFAALCHILQEGENELIPKDAFWLGLIDEVIGEPDLPTLRILVESNPS